MQRCGLCNTSLSPPSTFGHGAILSGHHCSQRTALDKEKRQSLRRCVVAINHALRYIAIMYRMIYR
jgi:hypothetical protein